MSNSNKKKKEWEEEKDRLLNMTVEERRKRKFEKTPVSLKDIPSWVEEMKSKTNNDDNPREEREKNNLNEKVSLHNGDITLLEIDAIVNAANSSLLGGGGVDGCIHRASGSNLVAECRSLGGCQTGQAKITCGYNLPSKYVIHTVGPIARGQINDHHKKTLASCYNSSLELAKEKKIRTIAFPCISTGIYGFPNEPAADVALTTVKEWLKKNHNEMDRIIFCVFLEVDVKIYEKKMSEFFPIDTDDDDDNNDGDNDDEEETDENNDIPGQLADEAEEGFPSATPEEKGLFNEKITVEGSNEQKEEIPEDVEMASQPMTQDILEDVKIDEDTIMESQDVSPIHEASANADTSSDIQDEVKGSLELTDMSACQVPTSMICASPLADKETTEKPEGDKESVVDAEMNSQVKSVDGSNEDKEK